MSWRPLGILIVLAGAALFLMRCAADPPAPPPPAPVAATHPAPPVASTAPTYAGREDNAPWRQAARQRIAQIRQADLAVLVVDAAGRPVPGAAIAIRMQKHAYAFGSAVAAAGLLDPSPDGARYRQTVQALFNRAVMENDLKWPSWEANRQRAIDGVGWLREHGIDVRGHNLIWPSWRNVPRDLRDLREDAPALRHRIDKHITDIVGAMKGQLAEWDVVNEPYDNKDVLRVLGNEEMVHWFKLAHEADPAARLLLNDYPILSSNPSAHGRHFEATLQALLDGGAPLGAIGVQCHYDARDVAPPMELLAGLDRLARFKLPIVATELDITTDDEAFQADYLRDHLIAWFSHPATDGVIMWGFWEGRHWRPKAALFRKDWSEKASAKAWKELVFKEWWTSVDGTADAAGRFATRGFLGEYQITVEADGKKATVSATLTKESAPVLVVVK